MDAAVPSWRRTLSRARAGCAGQGRWTQRALALVLGTAAAFAMAPLYQAWVLLLAFPVLLWLIDAQPTRWRAFAVGWAFGAGYFAAGLYWVSFALLVDAARFAWLIPVAVFGFAFGMGLFWALCALVVRLVPGGALVGIGPRVVAFAGAWTLLEWVRTWLLTGFPWNPLGSVWFLSDMLAQGAAVIGVLGLSFVAALVFAAPAALAEKGRAGPVLVGVAVAALVVQGVGGAHRLANADAGTVDGVRLRLVQPNIRQADKWRPELRERHMTDQIALSLAPPEPGAPKPTHIIWAETSAPFFLTDHRPWLNALGSTAPAAGAIIVGAPRVVDAGGPGGLKVANSLLAIGPEARILATYDKFHLVPFGEYVPLAEWLPLERITQGAGAFTPGPGPATLALPGLPPVSPLICYEVIFPGQVTDGTGRAKWLLNLTNDAWYGRTAGPYQHFVSARARALETGLPVVRVAGTGISGVIDAYGRVTARRALGEKGFVDGDLPKPAARGARYAQWGNVPVWVLALGALALAWVWGHTRARSAGNPRF